jgi:hypothetical protein
MNGWQFLEAYEKLDLSKRPSLYILSFSVMREDQDRAKSYACVKDYFVKPISLRMLEELAYST